MKAWAFVFGALVVGSTLAAACGGSNGESGFVNRDGGMDAPLPDSSSLQGRDGATGNGCHPLTCAKLGYNCGKTGDGCGGMIDCGTCTGSQVCGGGGTFSVCGGGPCMARTCASQSITCGPAGDGCGNLLACGSCTAPDTCGGGGVDNACGHGGSVDGGLDGGPCVPLTCADQGLSCGPAGDGCGNTIQCGSCSGSETCGGGGVNGKCGAPAMCTPATCGSLMLNCGPVGDGCGGLISSCGTCSAPNICGGGGVSSVCGDVPACTNLCLDQHACGGAVTTTLKGTVVAGTPSTYLPSLSASPDPIPNVLVYVPNGVPAPFTPGVQCAACGADVTGSPLVEATTDYLGNFTLTNVPVPASGVIPLVIQLGRWRRIFGLGNAANPGFTVTSCATTNAGPIRMPRTQAEGDIPFTAISTGQIDPMECVLLKMGVDVSEFKNPGGGGRIEMYQGNGAIVSASTPGEPTLVPDVAGDTTTLDKYDQVIFPCWGKDPIGQSGAAANVKTANQQQNVVSYTSAGGRMFGTHLSYSWLYFATATPFNTTATWVGDPAGGDPDLEYDTGTAVIQSGGAADVTTFLNWMNNLTWNGASGGQFPIIQERNNFSAIGAGSELWMNVQSAAPAIPIPPADSSDFPTTFPAVYTFNTPYSTAASPPPQCGKVIYSDFHVSVIQGGGSDDQGVIFPAECTSAPMSAQEKALEYLIWDLSSCLVPPGPTCTPKTCAELGATCGEVGDGCGGLALNASGGTNCGACAGGCDTCGGGGVASVCGGCCVPKTCAEQHIDCGPAGDGCGNLLPCGDCPSGMSCGSGGVPGMCGSGGPCHPKTCAEQGLDCGPAGDGCGNEIMCGTCTAPATCGGGGQNGKCGPTCVPKTCAELGFNCGTTGNGCGGQLSCGTCTGTQTCGGGGTVGQCGGGSAK